MQLVKGTKNQTVILTREKTAKINQSGRFYGTIAEIGGGQETARHFFRVGGASKTIAKTMSAYDMAFSDSIYGKEESGRYVCESRLEKMLTKEYELLHERLQNKKSLDITFFAFANTVSIKKYLGSNDGHGWLGVRFQSKTDKEYNDVVIHVRLLDQEVQDQQSTLGTIGVNLIYSCFFNLNNIEEFVSSLMDGLNNKKIEVDMIRIKGPDLSHFDPRILGLMLVKFEMTEAVIFDPQGKVLQPAEVLYKKNIFVLRGSFRPPTLVNIDMLKEGLSQFLNEPQVEKDQVVTLCEITFNTLKGQANLDENDFLSRIDLLSQLGQMTLVSNHQYYFRLSHFFSRYTSKLVGMSLGILMLQELFKSEYYRELGGGILEAFGRLFSRPLKIYVYPIKDNKGEYINCENVEINPVLKQLYLYLKNNNYIVDYQNYHPELHSIYSRDVLKLIQEGKSGWEKMVPDSIATTIKKKKLFIDKKDLKKIT